LSTVDDGAVMALCLSKILGEMKKAYFLMRGLTDLYEKIQGNHPLRKSPQITTLSRLPQKGTCLHYKCGDKFAIHSFSHAPHHPEREREKKLFERSTTNESLSNNKN
jgi:hypothetical protein